MKENVDIWIWFCYYNQVVERHAEVSELADEQD